MRKRKAEILLMGNSFVPSQFADTLRTFNRSWLEDPLFREWLRYDQRRNRMFCRICERNEKNDRNQVSKVQSGLLKSPALLHTVFFFWHE